MTSKHKKQHANAREEAEVVRRACADKPVLSLAESAATVDSDARLLRRALMAAQDAYALFMKAVKENPPQAAQQQDIEAAAIEHAQLFGLWAAKPSDRAGWKVLRTELLAWVGRGMPGTSYEPSDEATT